MNRNQSVALCRTRFLIPVALVAAGFVAAGFSCFCSPVLAADPGHQLVGDHNDLAVVPQLDVQSDRTLVTFPGDRPVSSQLSATVYLPAGVKNFTLSSSDPGAIITTPGGLKTQRGLRVLQLAVEQAAPRALTVEVRHDGDWSTMAAGRQARLRSLSLHQGTGLTQMVPDVQLDKSERALHGVYLIVHGPAFTNAMAPLVEWKTRKGFEVVTVSTGETGASTEGIKNYLQNAYDTWHNPPEYVLLLGDVGDIPTFSFYGNPSDLDYVLLDGDDWLPDAMIGRLPVENDTEARTVINKIVGYERSPYLAGEDNWFTRSIMVGGVEGSDTPPHTVRYCGEQLQKIGFSPAQTFLHPPLPSNMFIAGMFNPALDTGASIVAYRGWAYGTNGWSDPRYEVNDMGGMNNAGKMPVVMSFVCLNGDYTASSPCFGEAFLRQGQPDAPRGAIAFIGNGEHWSHTRYNDAMAISFFEKIITPEITDLGGLMNASKLRYYNYFPHEVDAETFGEESVEFYFHIYNLLGDPDLHFWKSTPTGLSVGHEEVLPVGSNYLEVEVDADGLGGPIAGATVTAVSNGVLLGAVETDDTGIAWLDFPPLSEGQILDITVTGPGLITHESTTGAVSAAAHVTVTGVAIDDETGNDDQQANPGEALGLQLTMTNNGSGSSGPFSVMLADVSGPADLNDDAVDFTALASGASAQAAGHLGLTIRPEARDGDLVSLVVEAERSGDNFDLSLLELMVQSPQLEAVSISTGSDQALPGETLDFGLNLQSTGSINTAGGTVELELATPAGASLTSSTASFGACPAGGAITTDHGFTLQLDTDLAAGTNLTFGATITTAEGWVMTTTTGLVVGPVDAGSVSGPDGYGYYAYDSADLEYPAKRPVYRWNEISPTFGGLGTELAFPVDNEIVTVQVDLPFPFAFYGQNYTRIRVSDNGWISFDLAPDFNFYNWTMPSEHGNNAVIAPFWENLVPSGSGGANGIAPDGVFYHHDEVAGTFTVEWSRLHHYKPQILGMQTFQVVLLDPASHPTASGDGEMLFFYRNVTNNDYLRNYATVGIEDEEGLIGLQLSYARINDPGIAPLQPGMAIRVTTEEPVRVPFRASNFQAVVRSEDDSQPRIQAQWSLDDERPVVGWHLDLVHRDGVTRLTEIPLPPEARQWDGPLSVPVDQVQSIRLKALHPYGARSQPGEVALKSQTVVGLALHRASPNPMTGQTRIAFALPEDGPVRLRIYDAAGRLVRTLLDDQVSAGEGVRIWDGRDSNGSPAAGGVYFYRLETSRKVLNRKLTLVR